MFNSIKAVLARRKLESELNHIVELADGHKEEGVPPGDDIYKRLNTRADVAIESYKKNHKASSVDIELEAPTLRKVRVLAGQATKANPLAFVMAVIIAAIVLPLAIAFASATYHRAYDWFSPTVSQSQVKK